jgi:alpha-1,3/alpha-1,6-mannosyltransferase
LLYTPTNEHFGIVPVEAMQYGVPVLAANTGGPLETIVEGKTGWLRDVKTTSEWTAVIRKVFCELTAQDLERIGHQGQRRVQERFTRAIMANKFNEEIESMRRGKRSAFLERNDIVVALGVVMAVIAALVSTIVKAKTGGGDRRVTEFARAKRMHTESEGDIKIVF